MNPYLEVHWRDVHFRLIAYLADILGRELPNDLIPCVEEAVEVVSNEAGPLAYVPDLSVQEEEAWRSGLPPLWKPQQEQSTLDRAQPLLIYAPRPKHRWVEVRTSGGALVTVIEILSPSNKDSDRADYVRKRKDYVASRINVVEVDLLRAGRGTVSLPDPDLLQSMTTGKMDYVVSVTRGHIPERFEIYPCSLRKPLPVVRLPLRLADPDILVDVQDMIDRCYESGRYWNKVNYQAPPIPDVSEEDRPWLDQCLREAGLRN